MGKFEVGQRVRILTKSSTKHFGEIGEVVTVDDDGTCEVQFVPFDAQYFEPDELAPAEAPAADAAPAAEGVHDVQCRCGYMASQHWADGSCPGDGYPYDDAPENHMHTHEDSELYLQSLATRDQEVVALQAETERLQRELAAARAEIFAAREAIKPMFNRLKRMARNEYFTIEQRAELDMMEDAMDGLRDWLDADAQARQDAG